jgi:hypothetical protein
LFLPRFKPWVLMEAREGGDLTPAERDFVGLCEPRASTDAYRYPTIAAFEPDGPSTRSASSSGR